MLFQNIQPTIIDIFPPKLEQTTKFSGHDYIMAYSKPILPSTIKCCHFCENCAKLCIILNDALNFYNMPCIYGKIFLLMLGTWKLASTKFDM